jgi:hypothetical protein
MGASITGRLPKSMLPIFIIAYLCHKITASRAQCKIKSLPFEFCIAKAPRDLSKIAASRAQCKIKSSPFEF